MPVRINYEWDIETTDVHGDIVDHDHDSSIRSLMDRHTLAEGESIVLVVSWGDESTGIIDREWAYAVAGVAGGWTLPVEFDGGHKVPKKFHAQLGAYSVPA